MTLAMRVKAIRIPILVLASALALATQARAQWVERPFAPPVGSHWILKSEQTSEVNQDGRANTTHQTMTADLIFTDKSAEGYRIVYVLRAIDSDTSNTAALDFMRSALQNLTIRATVDAKGVPLRVDNIDEVHAAVSAAIDRMVAPVAGTPGDLAKRKAFAAMFLVDATHATGPYLPGLALLAAGQDTGLHPGETRTGTDELPSPIGGPPLKANATLHMASANAASGVVHLVQTRTYDPAAVKELIRRFVQGLSGGDNEAFAKALNGSKLALDSRVDLTVEGGMTRVLHQEDTLTMDLAGRHVIRHTTATVTVSPAT